MRPRLYVTPQEEERRRREREAARVSLVDQLSPFYDRSFGSQGALGPGETDVRFGTGSTRPYVLQGMPEPTPTPTSAVASPPPMFGMTSPTAPMSQPAGMFKREAIPEKQSKPSDFLNYVESFAPAVAGLGTLGLDAIVPGLGTSLSVPVKEATNVAVKTARGKTKAAKDAATRGAANIAVDAGARKIAEASKEAAKAKAKAAGKTAEGAKAAGEAAEGTVDAAEDRAAEVVNRPGPSTVDAAADAKALQRDRAFRRLGEDSLTLTGRERAELLNELTAEEARQERNYRRAITLAQSPELLDRMIESGGIGEETRANLAALGQAGLEEYDLFELGDPTSAGMRDSVKPLRGGFGAGAVSPLTGTLDYADPETRRRLQRMVALGAPREQAYVQMVEDMAPSQDVAPERAGIPEELVTDAISPGRIDPGSVFVPTAATPVSMDAAMARQALVEDPNMVSAAGTQADRILSAFDELPELGLAESVDRAVAAVEANPQAQYAFQSPMSAPMAGVAPPQSQPMFDRIGAQQLVEPGYPDEIRIREKGLEFNPPQFPIQEFSPEPGVVGPLPGAQVPSPSPMRSEDQQFLDRIASQNTQLRGPGQFSAFGGQQDMIDLPMESVGASQSLANQNPVMARDLGAAGQAYSSDYQKMVAPSNAPSNRRFVDGGTLDMRDSAYSPQPYGPPNMVNLPTLQFVDGGTLDMRDSAYTPLPYGPQGMPMKGRINTDGSYSAVPYGPLSETAARFQELTSRYANRPSAYGPVSRALRPAELELPESRFGIDQMRGNGSSVVSGQVVDPINVRPSLDLMAAPSPRDDVMQLLPYTQAGQPVDGVYLQRPVSGPLPPIDGATLTPPMTQMPPMTQTPQGLDGFMSLPMTRAAQPADGVPYVPGTTQLPPGFYIGADGYIRNALNQIVGM